MKTVYVFFIESRFGAGKAIRLLTRNKYTHVAMSFEASTRTLYSYARYRYHEPFLSGFGVEYTDRYAAGEPVDIKVCACPVTDAHYERIRRRIGLYTEHRAETRYNFFDLFTYPFGRHVALQFTHTCISFLLELLERPEIHTIRQLEDALADRVVYEGPLRAFEAEASRGPGDFFERRRRAMVYARSGRMLFGLCASLVVLGIRKLVIWPL